MTAKPERINGMTVHLIRGSSNVSGIWSKNGCSYEHVCSDVHEHRRCAALLERAERRTQASAYADLFDAGRISHRCIPAASDSFSLGVYCDIGCGIGSCDIRSDLPKIWCGAIHNTIVSWGRTSGVPLYISARNIRRVLQRRVHNNSDCGLRSILPLVIPGSNCNYKANKRLFLCRRNGCLYVARPR